jgi:hypothetical protein
LISGLFLEIFQTDFRSKVGVNLSHVLWGKELILERCELSIQVSSLVHDGLGHIGVVEWGQRGQVINLRGTIAISTSIIVSSSIKTYEKETLIAPAILRGSKAITLNH